MENTYFSSIKLKLDGTILTVSDPNAVTLSYISGLFNKISQLENEFQLIKNMANDIPKSNEIVTKSYFTPIIDSIETRITSIEERVIEIKNENFEETNTDEPNINNIIVKPYFPEEYSNIKLSTWYSTDEVENIYISSGYSENTNINSIYLFENGNVLITTSQFGYADNHIGPIQFSKYILWQGTYEIIEGNFSNGIIRFFDENHRYGYDLEIINNEISKENSNEIHGSGKFEILYDYIYVKQNNEDLPPYNE